MRCVRPWRDNVGSLVSAQRPWRWGLCGDDIAGDFIEDGVGRCGPYERLGIGIVGAEVVHDGLLQVGDACEGAATDALLCDEAEEALDLVEA